MPRRKRNRRKNSASKRVVYVALIGNLGVTATKFIAAAISGSAAMLSEGFAFAGRHQQRAPVAVWAGAGEAAAGP